MNDRRITVFNIFSVIFLTSVILWITLSMSFSIQKNTVKAEAMLSSIGSTVIDDLFSGSSSTSRTSNFVKLSNLSLSTPSLKSLVITDDHNSVLYIFAKNPAAVSGNIQVVDNLKDTLLSSFQNSNGSAYHIKTVFTILDENRMVLLLKYAIGAIFIYLVAGCFFLLSGRIPSSGKPAALRADDTVRKDKSEYFSKISNELKRAASFDQDMVLALIKVPIEIIDNGKEEFEQLLHETFFYSDLIFNNDPATYTVIIPNTDIDKGISEIRDFDQNTAREIDVLNRHTILYGLSSRNGRLVDGEVLFSEASAALKRAEKEINSNIVGFRPDPAKYREFLSKK